MSSNESRGDHGTVVRLFESNSKDAAMNRLKVKNAMRKQSTSFSRCQSGSVEDGLEL